MLTWVSGIGGLLEHPHQPGHCRRQDGPAGNPDTSGDARAEAGGPAVTAQGSR